VTASQLYRRGEPCADREIVFAHTSDGVEFRFSVVPAAESIAVVTLLRNSRTDDWERFERVTAVEWQDWAFGSQRPWIVCAYCAKRIARAFFAIRSLAGSLLCHGCAGARYNSQDANVFDRLVGRIDAIRARLGGEPVRGSVGRSIPNKPSGMHWSTYWKLRDELVMLEGQLSAEFEAHFRKTIKEHRRLLAKAERQMASWKQLSGPHTPYAHPYNPVKPFKPVKPSERR